VIAGVAGAVAGLDVDSDGVLEVLAVYAGLGTDR